MIDPFHASPPMPITAHYVHVAGRAVHYRHRGSGPPVVLLHASPRSSASLETLMRSAPDGLSVFALDTPGFGHSDPISSKAATIEDFADALGETLTALGIARTRLYGTHTGADIALVFAVRQPARVVQLVLDGLSCFDADERDDLVEHYLPPFAARDDGTHMAWLWSRLRDQARFFPWYRRTTLARLDRPMPVAAELHRAAVDWLIASDLRTAYLASIETGSAAWVARLGVPTVIGAREGDVLLPHLARLTTLPQYVSVESFAADVDAWTGHIWRAMSRIEPEAQPACAVDAPIGRDTIIGAAGRRVHWRGRASGTTRPVVSLHRSPGSARAFDVRMPGVPCLALDLPGHGESDPAVDAGLDAMVDAVDDALVTIGLDDARLDGHGSGAALAIALSKRRPGRWHAPEASQRGTTPAPPHAAPKDDGGHLLAAWYRARDDAINGSWWSRDPTEPHDFGRLLDWSAIHRSAVAQLVEAPHAATWRAAIAAAR